MNSTAPTLRDLAVAFADRMIQAGRARPADRTALVERYSRLAADDAAAPTSIPYQDPRTGRMTSGGRLDEFCSAVSAGTAPSQAVAPPTDTALDAIGESATAYAKRMNGERPQAAAPKAPTDAVDAALDRATSKYLAAVQPRKRT